MKSVKVSKTVLKETLLGNRDTHQADFQIAWEAFRKRAEEDLQEKLRVLKHARQPQQINLWVGLEVPSNHAEDYDRAIAMLDWEVEDEVILQESEFKQFVQDDWSWSGKFRSDNVFYTTSESPSSNRIEEA